MIRNISQYKEAVKRANEASYYYYNTGTSIMEDRDFDILIKEIDFYEKETDYCLSSSPTQKVGAPIVDRIKKINISSYPMLSLKKAHSMEEVNNFLKEDDLIGTIKCDGLSVRIGYIGGNISFASTRGDGYIGSDITEHIKHFCNVPLHIPCNESIIIDGECIIKENDFQKIKNNINNFSNPRNTASGALSLYDMQEVQNRKLTFLAWDLIQFPFQIETYSRKLTIIQDLGFDVVPFFTKNNSNEQILQEAKKNYIPCDGVVWRINNEAVGKEREGTSHHPGFAIAWKKSEDEYETTLLSVEWQIGRTGVLTPVAHFSPIGIGGTTISKASLHNVGVMESLSPLPWYMGYKLIVFKANEIIPQISAVTPAEPKDAFVFDVPKVCPSCGESVSIQQNGAVKIVVCKNPKCTTSQIEKIIHYASKKGMDIKNLSKATITKLWEKGWLKDIVDIYTLKDHRDEWIQMEGFGPKSVDNILAAIEDAKRCELSSFIAALGIPLIGKTVARDLIKVFPTYEDFRKAIDSKYDFSTIDRFAEAKSTALLEFDYTEADYIYKNFISIEPIEQNTINTNNTLKDIKVCITGRLEMFKNRDAFKTAIENAGGKVVGSVTSSTNYLINNDVTSTTSKNLKAIELGVKIISEGDFIKEFGL